MKDQLEKWIATIEGISWRAQGGDVGVYVDLDKLADEMRAALVGVESLKIIKTAPPVLVESVPEL